MNKRDKDQLLYKATKALIVYVKLNDDLDSFIANGCVITESPYKLGSNFKVKFGIKFNRCVCPKCSKPSIILN